MSQRDNRSGRRRSDVTPSVRKISLRYQSRGGGGARMTYPGRQYSTANLNTPCLSGAINLALYVVASAELDDLSSIIAVRI